MGLIETPVGADANVLHPGYRTTAYSLMQEYGGRRNMQERKATRYCGRWSLMHTEAFRPSSWTPLSQ